MKLSEVMKILEGVGPLSLSDEFCKKYNAYDNSGIIINSGKEACGALFSLDLSEAAADKAVELGYNLIITHHPAIYGGISRIDTVASSQSRAIAKCLKHGISVISMHLNFDCAPEGIDYNLMRGLGGSEPLDVSVKLSCGGYGRVYSVEKRSFKDYAEYVKAAFSNRAVCYGDDEKTVDKVASFCGAGCDDDTIAFAQRNGADVYVSSDMKHHQIAALVSGGTCVIQLTHYASENYGFNRIYAAIKDKFSIPTEYHTDGGLL